MAAAELAPYSDIDLLFLLPYKLTPHCEQVVEYILYRLWDLGLKVGQSARSIDECLARAKGDLTIRTALLEARYLWGEQELFDKFRKRFHKECVAGQGEAFYQAKLNERQRAAREVRAVALRARAQHQGRQRRPARPADPALDRPLPLRRRHHRQAGRGRRADPRRGAPLRQGGGLSVAAALPPALPARAGARTS